MKYIEIIWKTQSHACIIKVLRKFVFFCYNGTNTYRTTYILEVVALYFTFNSIFFKIIPEKDGIVQTTSSICPSSAK